MKSTLSLVFSSVLSLGSAAWVHYAGAAITAATFFGGADAYFYLFAIAGFILGIPAGKLATDRRSQVGWWCATMAFLLAVLFTAYLVEVR